MADSQRKTANLCPITSFDKTTDVYYTILFNTPIPTGTYTISAEITSTSTESRISFRKGDMSQIIASNIIIQTGRSQLTVTLNEPCYGMYIYGGTTVFDNIPIKYENIMLNTGSTALPYEPYGWVHSLRKLGTSTDTITTLPADLYADGNNATVGLVGNMQQSGTPTPQNPITPQETGERTGNLFDGNYVNAYLTAEGVYNYPDTTTMSIIVECKPNTTYTIKQTTYVSTRHKWRIAVFDSVPTNNAQGTILVNDDSLSESTITTLNDSAYIVVYYIYPTPLVNAKFMINLGSQPLPYEPYGYKLDIKSANTTTPVYLGEVESTRKIKKYEFTGQETVYEYDANNGIYRFRLSELSIERLSNTDIIVSHFSKAISTAEIQDGQYSIGTNYIYLRITSITSGSDFKTYLAAQYAAGTPVTVWYVLATPQTAVVNEPIRKIGDYADGVSGITIPTITGKDTFDVLTTLKPSEVELTYTGWHDASVKEKSRNLFDDETASGYYNDSGVLVQDSTTSHSTTYIPVNGTTYTASGLWYRAGQMANFAVYEWDNNKNWLRRSNRQYPPSSNEITFTIGTDTAYITLQVQTEHGNIMLNIGSTALPYEPYWK